MPSNFYEERKFKKWFFENTPFLFRELQEEVPLFSAYGLLEYDVNTRLALGEELKSTIIGKIDFIFNYNSRKYVTEVKYLKSSNSDFWYATKAILYNHYYRWQSNQKSFPAIMIPLDKIKLEHLIIANKAHLKIFGIEKIEKEYRVYDVDRYQDLINRRRK